MADPVYALATIGESSMLHLAGVKRVGNTDRWRWAPFCGAHVRKTRGKRKFSVVTAQHGELEALQCTRCAKALDTMPSLRSFVAYLFDPTPAETYGGTLPEGATP